MLDNDSGRFLNVANELWANQKSSSSGSGLPCYLNKLFLKIVSCFQKGAWKLLARYLIVTKEVTELRAQGVMLFAVLCAPATEVLVSLLEIGSIQLQLEDSVTV